ncbi:MAG TPA: hypothetical protein VFO22_02980 [Candidatus Udaeobacter sp.]|nr:hypothetical protein [Candidatus Udaeobacter sp.]
MKTAAIRTLRTASISTIVFAAALALLKAEPAQPDEKADPWKPLRVFIGKWEGDVAGEPGTGKTEREYAFILKEHFIQVLNKSTYPPQKKNPKGETHEDIGFLSYDKAAKKLMLRQFHIEGFVNQFASEKISDDGRTIVFVSTAIENIAPGWRARETYRILNDDEFIETFALAAPNRDFATYSETHFRLKK